jgi:hypothetical protein
MKLGAPESSTMVNSMIAGTGVITAGYSAIRFKATPNPTAKGFYAASLVFSSGAVASGGVAALTRMCKVSEVALLSEVMGGAFLWLGEMAHAQALIAEGKPLPPHLQKWAKRRIPLRRAFDNNQNLSFVMPGNFHGMSAIGLSDIIERIPFERIGKIVGVGLTAYGYYKIVLVGYRYSQKLITKYKENRKKIKFKNEVFVQAKFVSVSLYFNPFVQKNLLINRFIINNPPVIY